MSDREKFEAFKEKLVKENEEKYGEEIRRKFGDEEIDASNRKVRNMSEEDWKEFRSLEKEILTRLREGIKKGILPESGEAREIVLLHREWLGKTWKQYTKEAHKALAAAYTADERFKRYYDRETEGCAKLLKNAVQYWADRI